MRSETGRSSEVTKAISVADAGIYALCKQHPRLESVYGERFVKLR